MAQDNVDVFQGAWDAFGRGDIDAVLVKVRFLPHSGRMNVTPSAPSRHDGTRLAQRLRAA